MGTIQKVADLLDVPIKTVKLFLEKVDTAQPAKRHYTIRRNIVPPKVNVDELFESLVREYDIKL
ncbi:MAG: hypothetical protein ACOYVD_07650 [Bacillota bacterium]